MSNEKVFQCTFENSFSNDISKVFLNKVDEIYNLYNEELLKGNYDPEIFNTLNQYLIKNQLKPNDLINFCLNNQSSSICLGILVICYRYGKWVEKDENKAFFYCQK